MDHSNTNELCHHGILGMKWGVRRYQNKDGTLTAAGKKKKKASDDKKAKRSMKNDVKNRRLLSDNALKQKIERLKLQKQLKDLTKEEIQPGKKFVSDVLSSSGKKVATAFVTGAVLYGTKAALTKNFDIKDFAGYVTPKPKK